VGLSTTSYGVRVGVRASDPVGLSALLDRLPPGWRKSPRPTVERLYSLVVGGKVDSRVRRLNMLYRDADLIARTRDLDEALETFAADVHI